MPAAAKHKRRIRLSDEHENPLYAAWLACGFVKNPWGEYDRPSKAIDFKILSGDFSTRRQGCQNYSWAVPSPEAIAWAAKLCPRIIEIGAGRGYWAKQLAAAGCDVVAYDAAIRADGLMGKNDWHPNCTEMFFPVQNGRPADAGKHSDRTLFLCWPPYDDPMAANSLNAYAGREMLFVGEGDGGCCGDARFWDLVSKNWEEIGECHIPQWPCIHDWMWLYRRK